MTIKGLIFRFAIAYLSAIFLAGAIVRLLALKSMSGVNIGILLAAALYATGTFIGKNRRFLRSIEKWHAVGGMLLLDMALQIGIGWSSTAGAGGEQAPYPLRAMVLGMLFIALVHGIVILGALGLSEKMLAKHSSVADVPPLNPEHPATGSGLNRPHTGHRH